MKSMTLMPTTPVIIYTPQENSFALNPKNIGLIKKINFLPDRLNLIIRFAETKTPKIKGITPTLSDIPIIGAIFKAKVFNNLNAFKYTKN